MNYGELSTAPATSFGSRRLWTGVLPIQPSGLESPPILPKALALTWSDKGLVSATFKDDVSFDDKSERLQGVVMPSTVPEPYQSILTAYFAREAVDPTVLPVDLCGSVFELRVWNQLRHIGRGQVWSYVQVARAIGDANASRAVGGANGRNPLPVVVPCHRVVASGGKLGGYSAGLSIKQYLLALEGHAVDRFRQ